MRGMWTGAFALAAFGALGTVSATTAAAQQQDSAEPEVLSEEIIVTVQKREQALRDVPINVTAFSGAFLDTIGVAKFDELALFVPGLEIQEQSANNPGFVIRGITSDSGEANIEPRVAVFQDGVSISRSRGSYVELFDMERVEVAKGPQATLFGRGALIGGINLIQKKADPMRAGGAFEGSAGEYGSRNFRLAFNTPLIQDVLAVRVAGASREHDAYTENLVDGEEDLGAVSMKAFRASVRFTPTEALTVDLIGNYQEDDNSGTSFKSGTFAPTGGDTSPFTAAALNSFGGNPPLGLERKVESVTLLASYDVSDSLRLSSISGYRFFDSTESFDPDGSALPLFSFVEAAKGLQYSQELRLNFDVGSRLSGFVGGSFVHEEGRQTVPLAFDERVTLSHLAGSISRPFPQSMAFLTNPAVTAPTLAGLAAGFGVALSPTELTFLPGIAANLKPAHAEFFQNAAETDTIDLFADLTFKVTDKLELTGGVRYTKDDKVVYQSSSTTNGRSILGGFIGALSQAPATRTALLGALATPGAANIPESALFPVPNFGLFAQPITGEATASGEYDDFTWRLVAKYALGDDFNLFASYARGRRPEVLTTSGASTPNGAVTFRELPSETVDSVEFGAKGRFLDGALNLDGSVFYYAYNDFQTTEFRGAQIVTVNAGEATSYGFEGQAQFVPTRFVEVFGNYAYNHSRFDAGARKGNSFRLSPDHTFALGGVFTLPVLDEGIRFTPTYTWQSEVFFDDDNDVAALQLGRLSPTFNDTKVDEKQGSYGLLNLRLAYAPRSAPGEISIFVNNATDEEYIIDAGNTGDSFGIPTFIRGTPRVAGVEVKGRF